MNGKKLDEGIIQLKIKFFSNSDMNLKAIRRKNYDDNKLWQRLSKKEKQEFNNEFYNLICKSNNLILAGIINKEKMDNRNKELLFYLAYGFIIQRYQYFLSEKREYGCIVMDIAESSEEIKNLYNSHKKFLKEGVPVKREDLILKTGKKEIAIKDYKKLPLKNICENLIFLNDTDNNMLQVVDMITAAMFAKYNRSCDIWFNKIKSIIRSDSEGNIEGYGIKFFPEK